MAQTSVTLHYEVFALLQMMLFFLLFAGSCGNIWTGAGCWKWDIRTSLQGLDTPLFYDAVVDKAVFSLSQNEHPSETGQFCASNSLLCLAVSSAWCKMVSALKLCPFLLTHFHVSATGQITALALVLTSLCPAFSVLCLFFSSSKLFNRRLAQINICHG